MITSDVALAEGRWEHRSDGKVRDIPLVFVLKKDGDNWQIAAARIVAYRSTAPGK